MVFAIVILYLSLINLHFDTKIIAVNYIAAMLLIKKEKKVAEILRNTFTPPHPSCSLKTCKNVKLRYNADIWFCRATKFTKKGMDVFFSSSAIFKICNSHLEFRYSSKCDNSTLIPKVNKDRLNFKKGLRYKGRK